MYRLWLFAFLEMVIVRWSCEGYNIKKTIKAESSRVYSSIVDDDNKQEIMIGKVLKSYAKPLKTLQANFPSHDIEIQLEFQRSSPNQEIPKHVPKRQNSKIPIYFPTIHRQPNIRVLHERDPYGAEYLVNRNENELYPVPSHNPERHLTDRLAMENYLGSNSFDNVAGRNGIDHFGSRNDMDHITGHNAVMGNYGVRNGILNYGGHNVMDNLARQNMDNFGGRSIIDSFSSNGMGNLAGHNVDHFRSRNAMGSFGGHSLVNKFADPYAMGNFAERTAMDNNYPVPNPMNHVGARNVIEQAPVHVAMPAKGIPQVARQAEAESTTTETTSTTTEGNKEQPLSKADIRQLLDEYAEKIISSKSGTESQKTDYSDQVAQVIIQDNGKVDASVMKNLDDIAGLIKKGVQLHRIDGNDQNNSFLPKTGLNWMRIKVPVA